MASALPSTAQLRLAPKALLTWSTRPGQAPIGGPTDVNDLGPQAIDQAIDGHGATPGQGQDL